jgi:hypothetical protein
VLCSRSLSSLSLFLVCPSVRVLWLVSVRICRAVSLIPLAYFLSKHLFCSHILVYESTDCTQGETVLSMIDSPPHLATEPHLYSLIELEQVKVGNYVPRLESLLITCQAHVENCARCNAKGYICEVCNSDDVIFPFDATKISECNTCKTLCHAKCWTSCKTGCPKCARIERYRLSKMNRPPPPLSQDIQVVPT